MKIRSLTKQQGTWTEGDSTEISGGAKDFTRYLAGLDWRELLKGMKALSIEQQAFTTSVDGVDIRLTITPKK